MGKDRPGADESSEDGLTIRFLAAGARLEQARSLEGDDPQRSKLLAAARKGLEFVGRFSGEHHHFWCVRRTTLRREITFSSED